MKNWRNSKFRQRFLIVVAIVLALSLALHPELRLLLPFLDAAGLDLLLTLLSAHMLMFLSGAWRPLWAWLQSRDRSNLIFDMSGYLGQYLWVWLNASLNRSQECGVCDS